MAERNPSNGTQKIFKSIFNVQFNPTVDSYSCSLQPTTEVVVQYINLSRAKEDKYYAEKTKTMIKEKNIAKIICFEYCNPRIVRLTSNVEILSKLVVSNTELYEKIYFVFSFEEERKESDIFSYLKIFDITNRIPNFWDKVSMLYDSNEEKILKNISQFDPADIRK